MGNIHGTGLGGPRRQLQQHTALLDGHLDGPSRRVPFRRVELYSLEFDNTACCGPVSTNFVRLFITKLQRQHFPLVSF